MTTLILKESIRVLDFITPLTDAGNVKAVGSIDTSMTKIVSTAFVIAGALIAIALIYSIVKDAFNYAKGQGGGNIWAILGKIVFLAFCLGVILTATNWRDLADQSQKMSDGGLEAVTKVMEEVVPSTGDINNSGAD